jgi:hypothetical protein
MEGVVVWGGRDNRNGGGGEWYGRREGRDNRYGGGVIWRGSRKGGITGMEGGGGEG